MELLTVGSKSKVGAVAGAMAACLKRDGKVGLRSIGPGAVNQTVKALALCRKFEGMPEMDLICVPQFVGVPLDNGRRTAIRFLVEPRKRRSEHRAATE